MAAQLAVRSLATIIGGKRRQVRGSESLICCPYQLPGIACRTP